MSEEQRVIKSTPQVAYMIGQKKIPLRYKPVRIEDDVKFLLIGDGLDQVIANFFANDPIPVQDYLAAFTTIRNIVAEMKAGGANG